MNSPFEYPVAPLVRRHGPRGYEVAASYKPWLRDEFTFRCVFCLSREAWLPDVLDVDHFESASTVPERALDYSNLLYACRTCNGKKGARDVPDPCVEFARNEIALGPNGLLIGRTPKAKKLILTLALNTRRQREYRVLWVKIIEMARQADPPLYRRLMGYPEDLPDLTRLHPPDGNAKPEGIEQSHFQRRRRGELPDTY